MINWGAVQAELDHKSALTPEQWSKGGVGGIALAPEALWVLGDEAADPGRINADELPALIALANAALPDDSQYKITHLAVEMLREAATACERVADEFPGVYVQLSFLGRSKALGLLAERLAALLPPDAK